MPTEFRDPRSAEIHRRLLQLGEGPAAFFADAYGLIEGELDLQASSHLIGHALRELECSVRDVLATVTGSTGNHADQIREITLTLAGADADAESLAEAWRSLKLHRLAHRDDLRPPRPVDESVRATWDRFVDILSVLLDRFEATYTRVFRRLDELLEVPYPVKDQLDEVTGKLPDTAATASYFYSRLESPGWFDGLRSRGAFSSPPEPIEDPEEGTIRFPHWPQAEYLLLVAPEKPESVANVVTEIQTTNPRVQEAAIEVALLLPLDQRLVVASQVSEWIPNLRRYRGRGDPLIDFVISVSTAEGQEVAQELVAALLAPTEGEELQKPGLLWHLQKRSEELLSALASSIGLAVIDTLGDALDLRLAARWGNDEPVEEEPRQDHSISWLPNLENVPPHRRDSWPAYLATHLNRITNVLVEQGYPPGEVAARLSARDWDIYRRLELAFLSRHAAEIPTLVQERLLDDQVWDAGSLRTERASLLRQGFEHLETHAQEHLLEVIWEGPDLSWEDDEQRREGRRRDWTRDWLALIEAHLDDEWRDRLEALRAERGEEREIARQDIGVAWSAGLKSPKSAEELAAMGTQELLDFLQNWTPEPESEPFGPSVDGLAEALTQAVGTSARLLSEEAQELTEVPIDYARAFLDGFRGAVRGGETLAWSPILRLCEAFSDRTAVPTPPDQQRPPEAPSIRLGILHLLNDALSRESSDIPMEEREALWQLVERLATDPDPTKARETQRSDYTSLALNSVRPMALRVGSVYARRIFNASLSESGEGEVPEEFLDLLAGHLDLSPETSLAERAAVGKMLGLVVAMSPEWIEENLDLLLPDPDEAPGLAGAVFDAHLQYGHLHGGLFPVLLPGYRQAVDRTTSREGNERFEDEADRSLADHLMIAYRWGEIELDDTEGLIPYFFAEAAPTCRERALHFVGWSLCREEEAPEPAVRSRLETLWEWRSEELLSGSVAGEHKRPELETFGWWFASRVFEPEWSLDRLREVLQDVGSVDWAHAAGEYLVELFPTHSSLVLDVVEVIDPKGGSEPWRLLQWKEHVGKILEKGLAHDDEDIRRRADEVLNRWVATGHTDLTQLLPPDS